MLPKKVFNTCQEAPPGFSHVHNHSLRKMPAFNPSKMNGIQGDLLEPTLADWLPSLLGEDTASP